jgi:hypothetical protein
VLDYSKGSGPSHLWSPLGFRDCITTLHSFKNQVSHLVSVEPQKRFWPHHPQIQTLKLKSHLIQHIIHTLWGTWELGMTKNKNSRSWSLMPWLLRNRLLSWMLDRVIALRKLQFSFKLLLLKLYFWLSSLGQNVYNTTIRSYRIKRQQSVKVQLLWPWWHMEWIVYFIL